MSQVPTSTQWTRDAVGDAGRQAVESVYLIRAAATESQGTGFLLDNGYIVTNQHVIAGNDPDSISALSAYDETVSFTDVVTDPHRDLAVLDPDAELGDGLRLELTDSIKPGSQVTTWGYPIGYAGPSPLLSVGFLAGFQEQMTAAGPVKQLVVNGAFNNGNSGGPLFVAGERRVVGVVLAKHVPLTQNQQEILQLLSETEQGLVWDFQSDQGEEFRRSLAQLVSEYLHDYHQLTQLMIGHAVDAVELTEFLEESDLPVPKE